MEKRDNYELARQRAQQLFAEYDQEKIIKRFGFKFDKDFIYFRFLSMAYKIDRLSGQVFRAKNGIFASAGFSDSMTIYDVLCTAKEDAVLSGNFCSINNLPGVHTGSQPQTDSIYKKVATQFDGRLGLLKAACLKLGGREETEVPVKGDLVMRIHTFDFLPAILQFYESDEEFAASINLMWDENITDFMKYETVWYATGFIYDMLLKSLG